MDYNIYIPGEYNLVAGLEIVFINGKEFVVERTGRYLITEEGITQIEDKEPEKKEKSLSSEEYIEKLRQYLQGIVKNIRYEKDDDGNWHTFYIDKPNVAAATEAAREFLDKEEFHIQEKNSR